MRVLQQQGYDVLAVASLDNYSAKIEQQGIRYIPIVINGKGTNPAEDGVLVYRLYKLFKCERPDVILTFTPKPNIYCSIAARFLKIPVINNIAGLGTLFIEPCIFTNIAKWLYWVALHNSKKVFFQNYDDLNFFVEKRLVKKEFSERIPGSGVDTQRFFPMQIDHRPKQCFVFLLVARMIRTKGVCELVEAVRVLKERHRQVECQLLGFLEVNNPSAVTRKEMQLWVEQGLVTYLGESDDVVKYIRGADCVVLPSYYREGVPRSLLEAAAVGKPIITTNAVGCREVIDDGVNGYICKVRDSKDLADKMECMLNLSEDERNRMGMRGREKVIREFDERVVIRRYLNVVQSLLEEGEGILI
jgi:glycosyltransferase involved in cell wall biosynthesis